MSLAAADGKSVGEVTGVCSTRSTVSSSLPPIDLRPALFPHSRCRTRSDTDPETGYSIFN